jgi:hypothetical protein
MRIARGEPSRAIRIRVDGARFPVLVECRAACRRSMARVYVLTLLIWLSCARWVPSGERRIAQRK